MDRRIGSADFSRSVGQSSRHRVVPRRLRIVEGDVEREAVPLDQPGRVELKARRLLPSRQKRRQLLAVDDSVEAEGGRGLLSRFDLRPFEHCAQEPRHLFRNEEPALLRGPVDRQDGARGAGEAREVEEVGPLLEAVEVELVGGEGERGRRQEQDPVGHASHGLGPPRAELRCRELGGRGDGARPETEREQVQNVHSHSHRRPPREG